MACACIMKLSILMITKNAGDVIEETLKSVAGLWDELLVDDAGSTDGTVEIVRRYGGKIFHSTGKNLGKRKQGLVKKAKGDWILVLDADERVSEKLYGEILQIRGLDKITLKHYFVKKAKRGTIAYALPYQNYVFGRPVYWGGEKYSKVRLFRKGWGRISAEPLHEEVIVEDGNVVELQGVIYHHSFRTPLQLFGKFTRYAWIAAQEKKRKGETLSFGKLFLYAPHMFWARYVKEKGYKDGWRGFVLAAAFAYMEGLTYWLLLVRK